MSLHIVLDSSPLSLLSLPSRNKSSHAINEWAESCLSRGHKIYIPEVIDYELRRELLRLNKTASLAELDNLKSVFRFIPLSTPAMKLAASLWAQSRNSGQPTGHPLKLDIDVILVAQAITLPEQTSNIIIATQNIGHISWFIAAKAWNDLVP